MKHVIRQAEVCQSCVSVSLNVDILRADITMNHIVLVSQSQGFCKVYKNAGLVLVGKGVALHFASQRMLLHIIAYHIVVIAILTGLAVTLDDKR